MTRVLGLILLTCSISTYAQENYNNNKFKQLHEELATPNVYRTGSGAPGHQYYQNRADYSMEITLNDEKQQVSGKETIQYHNASPDPLDYIWIQLDQNVRANSSDSYKIRTGTMDEIGFYTLSKIDNQEQYDGGFKIQKVTNDNGKELPYVINQTMMRIDLEKTLMPGESVSFNMEWWYNVNDRLKLGGRSGYEYFEEEGNYLYTIAQFYPRMCVYNDEIGWQNKQFLGAGEFTLPFGDYEVKLTVPSNHVVTATGELQNPSEVLTAVQIERLEQAKKETVQPVFIISEKEAIKNEKTKANGTKTWIFKAQNVRDFAFASSKKFIWDAMTVKQSTKDVLAMSLYPKEGNPLWEQYSTKAVAQTLRTYSKHTFDYPYPVAISVHTHRIGMEYPMICFNGGRPDEDGTYSERTKYGMISVIIHEVGHNYFPMIVNSDERQWTWMDEGLNTFLQFLTEKEWDKDYPCRRGPAHQIVDYMGGDKNFITPIMTNSESLWQFGPNAYGKPATALNILRETIMGRELFDHAFKTYATRWMFKHPTPADFFRTMEDASAVDLDWFWRGWFFTNDHVDISISDVKYYKLSTQNPEIENKIKEKEEDELWSKDVTQNANKKEGKSYLEQDPTLIDFYNKYNKYAVTEADKKSYQEFLDGLSPQEKKILNSDRNYYEVHFDNLGGLVMPVIIEFTFEDGTKEVQRIPAEIWRLDNYKISKVFISEKKIISFQLDPFLETADTEVNNNSWPRKMEPTRFELYRENFGYGQAPNPMKEAKK
ncbi:MAG: M1 family metallopeptidase [Flavobacteriales bacterium]|nr:M1 family metallopeptidase [Flavobacteriales bacterium]